MAPGTILIFSGCARNLPRLTEPNTGYLNALRDRTGHLFSDPAEERAALDRVMGLFRDYSPERLKAETRNVYAERFYFRDGLRLIRDIDTLEAYFLHSAEPLRSCTFTFSEPAHDQGNYYLRWTMEANLKRSPEDETEQVIGLSHIRFNALGKVIFQQDYWDPTDLLYRKIPIANRLIDYVRSKL